MSRFGADPHAFFRTVYDVGAPWEVGDAQPAMAALIAAHPPQGPILDLGCASGDLAIHLARLGHTVLGVDFIGSAIEQAMEKRAALAEDVAARLNFRVADATRPSRLGRFGAIFDSGFLHLFDEAVSDRLVADVATALRPSGRYYLHEFAVEFPIPNVPRAVTEEELRRRFSAENGWRLLAVHPTTFLSSVAPPAAAIAACAERL